MIKSTCTSLKHRLVNSSLPMICLCIRLFQAVYLNYSLSKPLQLFDKKSLYKTMLIFLYCCANRYWKPHILIFKGSIKKPSFFEICSRKYCPDRPKIFRKAGRYVNIGFTCFVCFLLCDVATVVGLPISFLVA